MAETLPKKRYTVEEYYALERAADYKSDYLNGEIFPMSGGTIRHSAISINIAGELRGRLKGKPCRAYESNLRLRNKLTGLRNYADVTVICGPIEYDEEDTHRETVTNPTVVFEVLSAATEAYDRGLKTDHYRRMSSLKAYVLVSQDTPKVEIHARQSSGAWQIVDEYGIQAILKILALGIELPFTEIYDGVDFPADSIG